jgi:hypothetical protein
MKKINIVIASCLLIVCLSLTITHARDIEPVKKMDIELAIKEVERIGEEEIAIKYSVINRKNFDRYNVSLVFKILEDNKPIGCKEIRTTIPIGSDGSDIQEVIINTFSGDNDFKLTSRIFYSTKRYRIEEWFSGCREF